MKKLSNYELSELTTMVCRMLNQVQEFNHVSEKMDARVLKTLTKYQEKLYNEESKRAAK